jgi:predicted XRE-type DNA-binding protein
MQHSLDSFVSADRKDQLEAIIQLLQADAISQKAIREMLGLDEERIAEMMRERTYEEKREHMIHLCLNEGTDLKLHNDIVTELLMHMDGGHPAFGNVVGLIYQKVEDGQSIWGAIEDLKQDLPEFVV